MKKLTKATLVSAGLAVIAGGAVWDRIYWTSTVNDLGLTRADMARGGHPDMKSLRSITTSVADAYLARHQADLAKACGGPYQLTADHSLTQKVRNLGYKSSFYYTHWDIYLPYSLKTDSGKDHLILVQLSDRIEGNKNDPNNFRVTRMLVIDSADQVRARIDR